MSVCPLFALLVFRQCITKMRNALIPYVIGSTLNVLFTYKPEYKVVSLSPILQQRCPDHIKSIQS